MEKFYQTASRLSNTAQEITDELFKFNPSFEDNGKKSLVVIADMARGLEKEYKNLQDALIKQHERRQIDVHDKRLD